MKRLLFAAMLLGLVIVGPMPTLAQIDIVVSVPPPIVFASPPEVIVLPETYVYVVPEIEEDIFFYEGWWWRPWQGRWYRSRNYSSGWVFYRSPPAFYARIPSGWRTHYREGNWGGHRWNHQRIPYQQLQHNWRGWQKNRHWERQNTWGVEGLKSKRQSREVRPSRGGKPRSDEAVKSRKSRETKPRSQEKIKSQEVREGKPQSQERVKPRKSREAKPQSQERIKSQEVREGKPQSQERVRSRKSREPKPQSHEGKPRSHEGKPQSHEGKPQGAPE